MNFLVLPPEVNSELVFAGPGSGPMLAAAAAWDGISTELNSAATAFSSVTADLVVDAWHGPASVSMANATAPYASWLGAAAAQAEESASQAQAAVGAFEATRAAMVEPALVAANRAQFVSLVTSNLFGQNAPAIAAAEATYEQMWAQAVSVMAGYHASSSAAVAQLGSWAQMLEESTRAAGPDRPGHRQHVQQPPHRYSWVAAQSGDPRNAESDLHGHTVAANPPGGRRALPGRKCHRLLWN